MVNVLISGRPARDCVCVLVFQTTKVFVNGVWVGIHRNPTMLVQTLRQMRRQVDISTEVSAQPIHP